MDLQVAKNLFPLSNLEGRLSGYFISSTGDVYSTMQSSAGKRMYGSNGYVTLKNLSYSKAGLLRQAKVHGNWQAETLPQKIAEIRGVQKMQGTVSGRNHAHTVDEGIKAKGWVIAQVSEHNGSKFLLFGSKPAIHTTQASVKGELERLATSKPGVKFVSLKIDRALVSGGLVWE